MLFDIVIYHAGCSDGFSAMMLAKKYHTKNNKNDVLYHPGNNGHTTHPEVKGKEVLMVDFCYDYDMMEDILKEASSVTVLDHHVTNKEKLEKLSKKYSENLRYVYDEKKCGAQITFEYFYPNEEEPTFLTHLRARDLGIWKEKESISIINGAFSYNCFRDEKQWEKLYDENFLAICLNKAVEDEKYDNYVTKQYDRFIQPMIFTHEDRKYKVAFIENILSRYKSDYLSRLTDGDYDIGVTARYDLKERLWYVSMRTNRKDTINLSEITKSLPFGGGHPGAAGFSCENLYDYFSLE